MRGRQTAHPLNPIVSKVIAPHDGDNAPSRAEVTDRSAYDDDVDRARGRIATGRRSLGIAALTLGATLVLVCGTWALLALRPSENGEPRIVWPETGAAAVGAGDQTALSPGAETARPIASLTKLIVALVVLESAPLDAEDPGPTFTMDAADVAAYEQERASGGQALPVTGGEVLTEHDLLELVVVASSNNHALSLTRHVFGDDTRFLSAARSWLSARGLDSVTLADATGMSPENRASAADLLDLARIAEGSPVVRALAAQDRTKALPAPDGGARRSFAATNDMLNAMGIDGLKTGHTDAAGFTAVITAPLEPNDPDGPRVTVVILGAPSAAQRSLDVARLLASARGAG